nr:BGTF surface domain-containing protein [Natronococcus amylolyticus]
MTSETSFREKGRAAFLAALMVMSVVAMSMSFAGAAAANSNDQVEFDLTEDDSLSGEDIWIGQELEVDGDFDEPVQLKDGIHTEDGDAETLDTLRPDDDGIVTVETDELEDDEPYHLYYTGDTSEAEFDVDDLGTFWANEHSIDVDFDADVVTEDGTLTIEDLDDREDVDVHVSGEHENESIDEDDLTEIFEDAEDEELEDAVLIEEVNEDDDLEADFSDESTGDYEFTVDVVDTTAEDSAEITVGEEPEADAQFNESTYEQNVGDVAEFGVDHDGTEDVTITVTDEEEYYTAEIETAEDEDVSDADNLTVEFDSYEAGQEDGDPVTVTDDEGEPVDVDVTEALDEDEDATLDADEDERLLPGDYELEVFPGTEDETDAAVLVLDDRSTGDMNTWIAPGDEFDADEIELEDIEDSTESDSVAEEDLLVVGVEASGIYSYGIDDGQWTGEEDLELKFEDTDEPRYGSADTIELEEGDDVIVDEDENRFFVVVDVEDEADLEADETWDVTFTVGDDNDYVDDEETAEAQFDVEESFVEFVGDEDDEGQLQIENSNESEITAETNLAPGTDGDFRLRASSEIYTSDAEVDDDGVLATTFDLSSHDEDDEIRTLSASVGDAETDDDDVDAVFVSAADDDEEETKDGFKIDADAPSEVNVDDDASLDVDVVNNNGEAGNATLEATVGDEEYTEELELDAGDSVSESFDFDTSEEADIDWSVETDDDSASGTLTVSDEGDANGENGENGANGENGENGANGENGENGANGDDANGADDADDDDETVPGFGVAVAIVALLGAAMLALRRQN